MNQLFFGHNQVESSPIPATFSVINVVRNSANHAAYIIRVTVPSNPPAEAAGLQQVPWPYSISNFDGNGTDAIFNAVFQNDSLVADGAANYNNAPSGSFVVTINSGSVVPEGDYFYTNLPFSFTIPAF